MTDQPQRKWRIGVVDDHEQIVRGLRATLDDQPDMELVAGAETVAALLAVTCDLDLALLDLRLGDGTSPITNIETLRQADIPTLVYTSGDEMFLVRQAASAGVMGVVRKNAREEELLAAMRRALSGDTVPGIDWAAAIDSDPGLVDLSPQLRRVLELYAAGESSARVARELDISAETVTDYVNRIRSRYTTAGRPAPTKTDLYKRAIEDGWLPIPRRFRR
ncbi:response regulator [Gordonia rhizosphera]|uniref:Putative two-component response regulator n=1 Tax=Gordonia rhizosphera NBRC 16068 TaxID=1108045 RepID=K6WWT6_9ACTN|nr:response regulator transcription factor [Gordonia rhizosphera]GAB91029.1 putative two-component response regulator [Gordonia rhizosphera NBRC 16068]